LSGRAFFVPFDHLFDVAKRGEIPFADPKRDELTPCSFGSQGRDFDLVAEGKSACFS
jgi:hypothetical protein